MTLDDLKRLFTRQTLFRLDSILSPKLVPILHVLGLAVILLWAISNIFWNFEFGFGTGLWGIVVTIVFGLFGWVALRIACEVLLVFFKSHEATGESVERSRYSASLLDEVRDAIRDLAEHGEPDDIDVDDYITPATEPAPYVAPQSADVGEPFKPKRTAKRSAPVPKDVT